eukprot:CAMPEP_0171217440 /NCGR_PEP_ID=MMETSP0790-20130122/32687_1 /TAXON_ID=2925 /ORGANISM="Alexandrium catenella, Strain OF101" /LENGTH=364 /DNA_ID=CAMNT_0011683231 /DNA_START=72 /DNA_END=1166 /DNA_ORIENTATION=+
MPIVLHCMMVAILMVFSALSGMVYALKGIVVVEVVWLLSWAAYDLPFLRAIMPKGRPESAQEHRVEADPGCKRSVSVPTLQALLQAEIGECGAREAVGKKTPGKHDDLISQADTLQLPVRSPAGSSPLGVPGWKPRHAGDGNRGYADILNDDFEFYTSLACSHPHLLVQELSRHNFAEQVAMKVPDDMRNTLKRVVQVAMDAPGRCAFAVSSKFAFSQLRTTMKVDYRTADKDTSGAWDRGYMSTRLKDVSVHEAAFEEAVHQWSKPARPNVWPAGHEAEGVSKDGFTSLISPEGDCLKSAVFIMGLPSAPLRWDNVGTLHSVAMLLSWALRSSQSAVVMRSIVGTVHVIVPEGNGIKALKCET